MEIVKVKSSMIQLSNITKNYQFGDSTFQALKNVNLDVSAAEVTALKGPSGSGKSTLLNICGLIDDADHGQYLLNGEDVKKLSVNEKTMLRRHAIGFVFQGYNLIPVMTVRENIEYPLMLLKLSAKERKVKVDQVIEDVGLSTFSERRPDLLSGGQRQRVAIARALVKSPQLIIADEPTANLDTQTALQIIQLMKQLGKQHGSTFLVATHDDRMSEHCDKVYMMTDGALR